MVRSAVAAYTLVAFWILVSAAASPPAHAQHCISYQDYAHWVGSLSAGGPALEVTVRGNLAYFVTGWGARFEIVDVSDPSRPFPVAVLELAHPNGFDLVADLAYIANGGWNLVVADVSDPAVPTIVGLVPTPGEAFGVRVCGTLAYVADGLAGIQVVDVSRPTAPIIIGGVDTPGEALRVAVDGDHCYVADRFAGLQVIDIGNPVSPALVASLALPGEARDIVVAGGVAFLAAGPGGLQIVDITNPLAPTVIGTAPGLSARGVYIEGSRAYLAEAQQGLFVYDISDPASPLLLGHPFRPAGANDVFACGRLAFLGTGGLTIVDVSNPAAAPGLGHVGTSGWANDVVTLGTMAYVACGAAGIDLVEFSDPASPAIVGNVPTPGGAGPIEWAGDYLCVLAGYAGLHMIDPSGPSGPTIVGSVSWPYTQFTGMVVYGDHAFVAGHVDPFYGKFLVVDLSDPAAPAVVYEGSTHGYPVAAWDGYLYCSYEWDTDCHLIILDIHNPVSPDVVGSVDVCADDMWVVGRYAYLAESGLWEPPDELVVLDLADPEAPSPVASVLYPGHGDLAGSGDLLYVGCAGLEAVDISRPESPAIIGESFVGGALAVAGDLVLVAAGNSGLYVLPAQCAPIVSVAETGSGPQALRQLSLAILPNPAAGSSLLRFTLPRAGEASLAIHDVTGRLVRSLVAGPLAAGSHEIAWDGRDGTGRDVASGIYIARLLAGGDAASARIVRVR